MASEDVIELGSSDEDAEPEPKKAKTVPNVMVHIPGKLPGVTIKPAKRKALPVLEKLATKPITVTKIKNTNINPYANKVRNIVRTDLKKPTVPIKVNTPFQNLPRINSPQFTFINKFHMNRQLKHPIRVQTPKIINNLPPNIIVKRTPGNIIKPAIASRGNMVKKTKKLIPKKTVTEVPTVELDDDECSPSTTISPQWYLRPEEQAAKSNLEQENNKEPEKSKIIEITIEDSPVKPLHDKRTFEIGTEFAITIDDSPVKPLPERKQSVTSSDDEGNVNEKEPNSRKKLEYLKDGNIKNSKTIEIELEPILSDINKKDSSDQDKPEIEVSFQDDVVEIQENLSNKTTLPTDCSEKNKSEVTIETPVDIVEVKDKEENEFHPVYQNFIDLCLKLENSDDMKKIVEKKIQAYYRQVPKEYTESEEFIDMVSSKITSIKAGPEKMYLYIKDIVDELNLQRKIAKAQTATQAAKNIATKEESNKFLYGEDSEFDCKRQRQIRKLEKTLKKLHRAIQLLEEQEVDFDDEDDCVYLLTERYKERMVRVHAKFCQLTNTKMPSEPRVQIDARPGQPGGPAKRLEKWINRKVPIGKPLPFPDFHDVIRCVREANDEDKLGWNEGEILEEARDLFMRCGKKLQRRRQENEWRLAASRISLDVDPAENDDELKKKLELNKTVAAKKEAEVFNKYVDRQNFLKLEAEEIGDKEAEESPVESEDEENNDEGTSLLNKEKRKERLKRLLQKKSKNITRKEKKVAVENNTKETEEVDASKSVENDAAKNTTSANKENKTDNEVTALETAKKKDIKSSQDKVHTLSDDSNEISSDIDELHLLEKLHSGNEMQSSTLESSDSDTPIAISDTLSSGDNRKQDGDVISIENSSDSESGIATAANDIAENSQANIIVIENNDKDTPADVVKSIQKTNNNEYSESVEDILLASSDDETVSTNKDREQPVCNNLEKDSISFVDPVVEVEQGRTRDDSKLENGSISNKETVDDLQVLNKDHNSLGSCMKSIEEPSCRIEKSCNEVNIDVDMTDVFSDKVNTKELGSLVDKIKTGIQATSNTNSSITVQAEVKDVNESINVEVIEKSTIEGHVDAAAIESLGTGMEVDKLTTNASPGLTV